MIHPSVEVRVLEGSLGRGVVATTPIPKGTLTWVRDATDAVVPLNQLNALPAPLQVAWHRYGWVRSETHGCLCGDAARYVNHSCHPNAQSITSEAMVALRRIEPGEQLTENYAFLNRKFDFRCECTSPWCRGRVAYDDDESDSLRQQVREALAYVLQVSQPLWYQLGAAERAHLVELARGHRPVAPLSSLRLHPPIVLERYLAAPVLLERASMRIDGPKL